MATYNVDFGIKTRSGCGDPVILRGLLSGAISGTGASDWVLTALGSIAPSGTYLAAKTFSKTSGQTYNLTVGADTVNITMVAAQASATWIAGTDFNTGNQIKTLLELAYNATGHLVLGDTIMLRDGTVFNPTGVSTDPNITVQQTGFAGAVTVTTAGSGLTNGSYYAVATTGGTGSGALLSILVAGNTVVHAGVYFPGTGWVPRVGYAAGTAYTAGDVLTPVSGFPGVTFTVVDLAGIIIVRSETPNVSVLANGEPRRGGGAIITSITFNDSVYTAVDFQYIDFYWNTDAKLPAVNFLNMRNTSGWGVGSCRCRYENGPAVSQTNRVNSQGMDLRLASAHENYFIGLETSIMASCLNLPTYFQTRTTSNVFRDNTSGDACDYGGYNHYIADNFFSNWVFLGAHDDGIQYGKSNNGLNNPSFGVIQRNIIVRGPNSTAGSPDAQPIFLHAGSSIVQMTLTGVTGTFTLNEGVSVTGGLVGNVTSYNGTTKVIQLRNLFTTPAIGATVTGGTSGATGTVASTAGTTYAGIDISNNITLQTFPNAIYLSQVLGPDVRYNTALQCFDAANYTRAQGNSGAATITTTSANSGGGVFAHNAANAYEFSQSTPAPTQTNNKTITRAANDVTTLANYVAAFPAYSGAVDTYADAIVAFTPAAFGTMRNSDGTYSGALFPDGSWNDGTVFNATPATAITSSVLDDTLDTGQTTTVMYQLDAPATVITTITPTKSGTGTGTFSASTIVLQLGDTSGSVDLTATGAGSLDIGCTNDRSLTNPATIPVTIIVAPIVPTAYTQSGSPVSPVALSQTITVTYTLNNPAASDDTITAAASLAGSFLGGNTVVIPNGQTTGTVRFAPSVAGTLSLTATDDHGLTDPSALVYTVAACNAAQLVAMGIRHA